MLLSEENNNAIHPKQYEKCYTMLESFSNYWRQYLMQEGKSKKRKRRRLMCECIPDRDLGQEDFTQSNRECVLALSY